MLLNSVIIVLREVLEAALMISVLLVLTRLLHANGRWLWRALLLGLAGAVFYGSQLEKISEFFDGVGQEIVNAGLQFFVFAALLVCTFLVTRSFRQSTERPRLLPAAMAWAVGVAVAREGSEILVYVSGFMQSDNFFANVSMGSAIGACIGFSTGVLLYYLLLMMPPGRSRFTAQVLIALIGAGMCAQATRLLIQADWLSVEGPLWDTSSLLSEYSTAGQLLYALIGYEASPSMIEVMVYVGSLLLMGVMFLSANAMDRGPAEATA